MEVTSVRAARVSHETSAVACGFTLSTSTPRGMPGTHPESRGGAFTRRRGARGGVFWRSLNSGLRVCPEIRPETRVRPDGSDSLSEHRFCRMRFSSWRVGSRSAHPRCGECRAHSHKHAEKRKGEKRGGRSGMRKRKVVMGMKQNGMKQKPAKLTSISAFSAPPREPILFSP
jgi:hypothetical protein